jgi:Predicted membrane protein (DUF2232)
VKGPVLLLLAFILLAPPVFLFAPLAALLLLARPASWREWLWFLAAATWTGFWLQVAGGLAGQFARAAAVLVTGTYFALTVWRPSARFSRPLAATGLAAGAMLVWLWHFGVGWSELQHAVEQDLWSYNRQLIMRLSQAGADTGTPGVLDQMSSMVRTVAAFYPALLTLTGLAGLTLAWTWHRRIARRPLGPALPGFAAFAFNDQLVWGWVVGLGLCLLPLPEGGRALGSNLLLVWAVLYAVRGLAVFRAGARRVPIPVLATLTVVAMFLLPLVVGGLTLLGLADTWLDFRRRLSPSAT